LRPAPESQKASTAPDIFSDHLKAFCDKSGDQNVGSKLFQAQSVR